jgi:hypothetical protein
MKINLKNIVSLFIGGFIIVSCGSSSDEKDKINGEILDPSNALNTDFDGKIFSIPSPIQMALLLKETRVPFNVELLNSTLNIEKYTTEYKQALNLGVFGADLGYASINEDNSASLNCLSVVGTLTDKLGLSRVFNKNFIARYEKNKTCKDSVLVIVSEAFRNGDDYLKNEKRKNTSALILTGGWIESIYYACALNKSAPNNKIVQRIGEQKQTMSTIIEILEENNEKGINSQLIQKLKNLKVSFDLIKIDYKFVQPKTNESRKLTTLQHTSNVIADAKVIEELASKIISIRESIIN